MTYYFPSENSTYKYLQANRGDMLGNIWASFGLDFQSNIGALRLSNKLVTNTTSSDNADLGLPSAFEYFDSRWWAICGTRVFKNSDNQLTTTFTEDASTGFQTNYSLLYSDFLVFDNRLWSTTATTLYSKASGSGTGAWTSRDTLGTNVVHKLAFLKKTNRLYFTDDTTSVSSINASNTLANSTGDYYIDLTNFVGKILTMVATDKEVFISCAKDSLSSSIYGTRGSILKWDGISSQPDDEYKLNTSGCLAMVVQDNVPYAIDGEGRILKYTGYGFNEIGRLPIGRLLLIGASNAVTTGRFVHFNGMVGTKDNTLLISINNFNWDNNRTVNENIASGVWEFDLETKSFTHKHPFTLKPMGSSAITDFGQNRILGSGALKINTFNSDDATGRGTILAGAEYYTDATNLKYGIFIDSPANPTTNYEGQKRGYFVTNWIFSNEIDENWLRLWTTHKKYLAEGDKMIFKYRLEEEAPLNISITWVNTTSFTTTTDVTGYSPTSTGFDGTYGGEVEVTQGTGSGSCSHITNIVNNAGTYTVTIDNAVTGVTTGTAKARLQKWIKLLPEVSSTSIQYGEMPIAKNNPRIQLKGCFEFTGDNEFHKMILASETLIQTTT